MKHFWQDCDLDLNMYKGMGMELGKIFDQYVSSYKRWIKLVIRLGNNEVLETLMKT